MFTITLYNFNKKINSTKKPTDSGLSYVNLSCEMKSSSSILFPVVDVRLGNTVTPVPLFNYAYIQEFKRYYWIDDIEYSVGYWTISMHCDALATFQEDILNSWQYVVRSASEYDETIADTLYMTKSYNFNMEMLTKSYQGIGGDTRKVYVTDSNGTTSAEYFFGIGITSGYFIIGIVGNNTTGVTYYCMGNASFKAFISSALTFTPSDMTDVSTGVANAVFNPIQYVTSVRWFPIKPYYASTTSSIKVGGYAIPGSYTAGIIDTGSVSKVNFEIEIPKHYSGKQFMNLSPFTELNLVFQPFGMIPLDTTKLYNSNSVSIQLSIDFCAGMCTLYVSRESPGSGTPFISGLIYSVSMEYGVTLPISSLVMDWKAGAVVSAMQFVKTLFTPDQTSTKTASKYSAPATRKSAGSSSFPTIAQRNLPERTDTSINAIDLLDKAMDLTASALGQVSTTGAIGSFMAFTEGYFPYIIAWFKDSVMIDRKRFGSPLYKQKKLSDLSGFCVCMNATLQTTNISAMQEEIGTIQTLLNNGVYLER